MDDVSDICSQIRNKIGGKDDDADKEDLDDKQEIQPNENKLNLTNDSIIVYVKSKFDKDQDLLTSFYNGFFKKDK